jgi:hypothetical protein
MKYLSILFLMASFTVFSAFSDASATCRVKVGRKENCAEICQNMSMMGCTDLKNCLEDALKGVLSGCNKCDLTIECQ